MQLFKIILNFGFRKKVEILLKTQSSTFRGLGFFFKKSEKSGR